MLNAWFTIRSTAKRFGLPALQLAYPRGSAIKTRMIRKWLNIVWKML